MKANIFDIERGSFVDGPGIRTTVFFKGCNLSCKWCHNPESQSPLAQMLFYKDKCVSCGKCYKKCKNQLKTCDYCGNCTLFCPTDARQICGKEYTTSEVLTEILKDKSYYSSGGGVTFSGGECMLQIDFLTEILKACKENGIHTAVDTAGHVPYASFEKILPYTDLFLYDVKCFSEDTHKRYVGASNSLILENLKKLLKAGKKIWIRVPIIPSVNDSESEMKKIKDFIYSLGKPEKIELLPYHALGVHKYSAIGKTPIEFEVPSALVMEKLRNVF